VLEAIEVLSALGDFVDFKEVMLAKKAEMNGEEPGAALNMLKNKNLGFIPVMDVQQHMNKIEILMKEADAEDGWHELLNEGQAKAYSKVMEDGDKVLRLLVQLDLPPRLCLAMFATTNDDMMTWYTDLKKLEVLEEFGEGDILTRWTLNLSWAI